MPSCPVVYGPVTYTRDDGRTLARIGVKLPYNVYTHSVLALDVPNVLLALFDPYVVVSVDAGCSWEALATVPGDLLTLIAAPGARAYGYGNEGSFLRIEAWKVTYLSAPVVITGLGVDRLNPSHIRICGSDATVWDSQDAGSTWERRGAVPVNNPSVYTAALNKINLDHIVVGLTSVGSYVSFDGGLNWTASTGLAPDAWANVMTVQISPADGHVVWAMGIELGSGDKHIYHSVDGGLSFVPVIDEGQANIVNGQVLAAHPTNPNLLYFVFGSSFGGYGTDVYKYHFARNRLTRTHNDFDRFVSIEFSPADPSCIYFGVVDENIE
ncbi:MAG: exo-alpha-sialidase [Acidobacteria bacterium]|nr:exo-alpha-sialidase [Acidobacteriota bacterium]